jgi:uncharacterized membrane protein YdjX (TVP38/TMEM64 family)
MKLINTKEVMKIWKGNYLKFIILFLAISTCLGIIWKYGKSIDYIIVQNLMNEYRYLSALIFILVFMLKSLLVVLPSLPLIVFAGNVYGPFKGFVISMLGALVSASFAFYLAKWAGENVINRIIGKKAKYLDKKIENHGIKIIAVMRAAFVIPFDILSYLAGITKMKYSDFLLGTFFGIVAEVFALVYFGHELHKPRSTGFIISIVTIILVIAVPLVFSKIKKRA